MRNIMQGNVLSVLVRVRTITGFPARHGVGNAPERDTFATVWAAPQSRPSPSPAMSTTAFTVVHTTRLHSQAGDQHQLQLCVGDITHTDAPVDLLCLSAFPNDYTPTPTSVVGALARRGISVGTLAAQREGRNLFNRHCWISPRIDHDIRRLLCFEHLRSARLATVQQGAPALVGDVFRAISEHVLAEQPVEGGGRETLACVRIPALSTGDQGGSRGEMLDALLRQAYIHLRGALPVRCLQVVLHPNTPDLLPLLVRAGETLKALELEGTLLEAPEQPVHRLFISYLHDERDRATPIWEAIKALRPNLELFVDRERLVAGHFWKMELMKGLVSSARALCIITDGYPESAECMDEFHQSMSLHLARLGRPFLLPLFHLGQRDFATLPTSMLKVQGIKVAGGEADPMGIARQVVGLVG
jgi:hypothetical protein